MTKSNFLLISATLFTGVITDSMCVTNHKMMHVSPDTKCVVECVKAGRTVRFVLYDGKTVYQLSDQQTPAKFAGQKVKVAGTASGNTIQITKIEGAK
jgi:hypothetical protein